MRNLGANFLPESIYILNKIVKYTNKYKLKLPYSLKIEQFPSSIVLEEKGYQFVMSNTTSGMH